MRIAGSITGNRREGTCFAVLLAVFALLVQALLPSAAMAAETRGGGGEAIVICTQMGVQVIQPDGKPAPSKGFAGLPCQLCLAAASAAVLTPETVILPTVQPIAHVRHAPSVRALPHIARAPPRPPGQGPPLLNA